MVSKVYVPISIEVDEDIVELDTCRRFYVEQRIITEVRI
jgi:hypothetical protein